MPATTQTLPSLTPDQQSAHRELCDERNRLVGEARALLDQAEAEKRSLSAEEQQTYDRLYEAAEAKRDAMATIERKARLALLEAARDEERGEAGDPRAARGARSTSQRADDERRYASYGAWLGGGLEALSWDQRRDLTIGTGSEGGYLAPTQFVAEMIEQVANATPFWTLVRKSPVNPGFSAQIPVRANRLARWTWTGEKSAGSEDTTQPYGLRTFTTHDCAGYIDVSNKLLRQAAIDVANDVATAMGQAAAETIEDALLTGNGAGRPLGLFVAHAQGVPTSRDFVGDNTTTSIKGDSLIDAFFGVKETYQRDGYWFFSRLAMAQIQKLKDATGQYIWTGPARDVSASFAGSIFGRPVMISEHIPQTFTTGLYVGMFADLARGYRVFWSNAVEVTRNPYIKQDENLTRFYGRFELDGAPVLAEAISRIKLG